MGKEIYHNGPRFCLLGGSRTQEIKWLNTRLTLGSVLATISLTVPVVVVVAILTGQRLVLGLDPANILLMLATFMVCQISLTSGKTNVHSGSAHVILFMAYVMLMFS